MFLSFAARIACPIDTKSRWCLSSSIPLLFSPATRCSPLPALPEPLPEAHPTPACLPSKDAHSTLRPATRIQRGLKLSGDTPLHKLPPMRPTTPRQPLVAQLASNEACNHAATCCLPRRPPPAFLGTHLLLTRPPSNAGDTSDLPNLPPMRPATLQQPRAAQQQSPSPCRHLLLAPVPTYLRDPPPALATPLTHRPPPAPPASCLRGPPPALATSAHHPAGAAHLLLAHPLMRPAVNAGDTSHHTAHLLMQSASNTGDTFHLPSGPHCCHLLTLLPICCPCKSPLILSIETSICKLISISI